MNAEARPVVLLVDDDQDFLAQMALRFEREGWRVETARNETEARAKLATLRPDLAVLDLMMDQLDGGFTLAHQIKKMDAAIPVLLVTGVTAETGLAFERAGTGQQQLDQGRRRAGQAGALRADPPRAGPAGRAP